MFFPPMDMTQGKRIWGGDPDKPVKTMIVLGSGVHGCPYPADQLLQTSRRHASGSATPTGLIPEIDLPPQWPKSGVFALTLER